jgi:Tc toxin complex TcA C-terminal TcB-binding domain
MTNFASSVGFHDRAVAFVVDRISFGHWDTQFDYTFRNFCHPFVGELIAKINIDGLPGLMDAAWQDGLETADPKIDPTNDFFHQLYQPQNGSLVQVDSFRKQIEFAEYGSYATYNWELFFHIPLTIAVHLSKTRRFAEAQRWFHYIFDPTSNDPTVEPPKRFWKFLAFRQEGDPKQIDALLALLSQSPADLSPEDQQRRADILNGYQAILANPFKPHAVARTRHLAYQYCVVMKYLDNLIAWGDDLFQQDTIESINEATLLYVLAANVLGPRPQQIPPRGTVQPKTFAQLRAVGLDPMGNALVELEGTFPFNLGTPDPRQNADGAGASPLFGIGRTLYFCIPRNEKLLDYWNVVEGRLFKIRHCMNIQGVVRPLALFDPPIDPGMLVKATAAGFNLTSIVSGLTQPISPVRCQVMIQKALELCAEVRNLGNSMLSAIEKGDAEHLALVRQRHEIQIQQMAQDVRFLQWKQAEEATTSLLTSRATVLERLRYYQRILGLPADPNIQDPLTPDRRELTEENFDDAYAALVGQYADNPPMLQPFSDLKLAGSTSPAQQSGASGQGSLYLISNENAELNEHLPNAKQDQLIAGVSRQVAPTFSLLPTFSTNFHFWGIGGTIVFGGEALTRNVQAAADIMELMASMESHDGNSANKTASYQRRADEWLLQYNLAAHELMQIGRQIIGSLIAEQIAHHEYLSIQQQIANAQEVDQLLRDKFTNEDLYLWMQGEISRLYYEYYRFAFDTARRAERTMKQELMRPELEAQDFVKFNYWDGGRKGLLSGEALYLDVKRMEMAYLDNNKRELELTRHVSLRQLDPLALLTLKSTGTCAITVPEWLYDRDCPGHYLRRIVDVAVSIPCLVGPYTGVYCTLSLLKSRLRKSPELADGEYARQGVDDSRFVDYTGAVQAIVTSGANADNGLFQTNLRDERFLPFEGAGAESTWKLELPQDYRAFDYTTISDVILHIRYTARQGVDRAKVQATLHDLFQEASQANLALLFSLRHDFPTEWSAFANGTGDFSVTIRRDHFPYFTQGKTITIVGFDVFGEDVTKHHPLGDPAAATTAMTDQQQFVLSAAPDAPGPTQILTRSSNTEVFLIVRYSL